MKDLFITNIYIKKVRHLENIDIVLSEKDIEKEKKNLIITGKNGSGKTSIILSLQEVFGNQFWELSENGQYTENCIDNVRETGLKVFGSAPDYDIKAMFNKNIFATLHADRKLELDLPKNIEVIHPENLRCREFIRYLLYLKYQMMYAKDDNNMIEVDRIEKWFSTFVGALSEIYDCPTLQLVHNNKDLTFKIVIPDREPFGLNEMADGYSSVLYIVIELMTMMEGSASMSYDMPGIVLIDEIETHLHVELQKRILPFLKKMFPRIQFIVTTHSPFIITSDSNAVVHDLERGITIEDMSAYSYEAVIEHYYDINMYSLEVQKQFEIYKLYVNKQNLSPDEMELFVNAITRLKQIPAGAAEELVYAFREMEAERRNQANGQT